ncbi:MAG: N-acetyltransferase family protein [Candidatus Woesearchaeota archaeon]
MRIRKAKTEDIDQIIRVFKDYEKASISYLPKKYKVMRRKKKPINKHIRLALTIDIEKKSSRFLVMEDNNTIVGYILGEIRDDNHPLFNRPKTGEFSDIAVLKEYQGRGIASKLYYKLEEWFINNKCEMITLSVNKNNPAKNIYENWGFESFYMRMIKKI